MDSTKFSPLRKGLLEFLILDIVSSGDVYVADILERLGQTDFATPRGPSIRCSARCGARGCSTTTGASRRRDRRASTTA